MTRYRHDVYASTNTPRYLVLFDLQWRVIECQRLEHCADLAKFMTATIQRLTQDGWQPEMPPRFGFVFLNRNGTRRLLILTERDPYDEQPQAFSPFK
jgi:hypothetical protein